MEVVRRICLESEGLEGRKLVYCRKHCLLLKRFDGRVVGGGGRYWGYRGLRGGRCGY